MRKLMLALLGVLCFSVQLLAQNRTITGVVTDATGAPQSNVSVVVKGTKLGTTTNAAGAFTLSVPENARTLVISSVGFETKQVAITGNTVNVQLNTAAGELREVVVQVPYGTVKKTAFTGSENTISAATIQKQQVTSVTRALEGTTPGIQVTNGGGRPGTNADIRIRGIGSINANAAPLYVLNGVIYDGSISSISTDDIESVTVLKDAAAASLYGSRAANGVIMITTKKGRRGAPAVGLNIRQGFMTRGIPEYDRVGPKEYYELQWENLRNTYLYAVGSTQTRATAGGLASRTLINNLVYNAYNVPAASLVDSVTGTLNPNAQLLWNDSWEDALYRTASRSNYNLSLSGAADKNDYYVSLGYLNEEGTVKYTGYKRYNARVNVNNNPTPWLTSGLQIDGAYSDRQQAIGETGGTAGSSAFFFSRNIGPIYPVYQRNLTTGAFVDSSNGQHLWDFGTVNQMGTRPYLGLVNPLGALELDKRFTQAFNGNASAYVDVKFLNHFSFKPTFGINYYNSLSTTYQNPLYGDAAANAGRSYKTEDRQISYTFNQVLSWNNTYGRHSVRALVGHENYKYKYNYISANKTGFQFYGQTELNNGATIVSPPTSDEDNLRIESYFANVNYDFDQKYLLSGSYRTDGSSRFAPSVRWGNFYSVGAGWRVSQENFIKNINWINELKLRASYGENGNEGLVDPTTGASIYYAYVPYYYASGTGTYNPPSRPANPDLKWETNKIFNLGLDFSILKNRVQGTIEYFERGSDNLLFDVPLPISTGNLSVFKNVGRMENKGWELQLGYNAVRAANFDWRIDLNLTHYKNKITKLPSEIAAKGAVTGTKKLFEGHGIYDYWLREYAGVDAANGDALYYRDVLDTNGKVTGRTVTNNINNATFYWEGSAIPDVLGGLTNSFRYKSFSLSVLMTFAKGGKFYDGNYAGLMHRGDYGAAWSTDIFRRWQKPGDVTDVPRLQNGISSTQDGASTRWLIDASYLNIKNVTLAYNIPKSVLTRVKISNLSVFANVDNAWLFSRRKGMDPQVSFSGVSSQSYPPFRTITFGVSANF
ncbi:MAG: SusC/RagA family TonB-linked outer membrane protein [Chitinophagaceae bacterium]